MEVALFSKLLFLRSKEDTQVTLDFRVEDWRLILIVKCNNVSCIVVFSFVRRHALDEGEIMTCTVTIFVPLQLLLVYMNLSFYDMSSFC